MTARDLVDSIEDDRLEIGSLSLRLVYLHLRYHAGRNGLVRISMAGLADHLGITRQAILKHVRALEVCGLTARAAHGRYVVYGEPTTMESVVRRHVLSLEPGQPVDPDAISRTLWALAFEELDEERMQTVHTACVALESSLLDYDEHASRWTRRHSE